MRPLVLVCLGGFLLNAEVSFNRDVRPIMADTCFRCHGPDASSRMAGLRLDIRDEALKRTRSGVTPIVPGEPDRSAIIDRIFTTNPSRIMPPVAAHKELTTAQKQTLRQWVAEGARYEGHWAFQPVRRPPVPASSARHPIDAFIQHRLAQEGLTPSPEADRATLLRRVSLDLTGIPPTPAELNAFLNDPSPQAYERVVDRLLASPRFAEKQTLHWLDAVRYADTCGFHGDNPFPAWPYRDYVLRSFATNKPFDQFTREQLAGDLLPNPTTEQLVASAYNRLTRTSAEGGIQPKEYLAKYAADRVRTTASVWLGVTMGCAECHDHKFDPISARDFYAFKAFFADIAETGLVPDRGELAWGSQLTLPSPEQQRQQQLLEWEIAALRARLPHLPEPDDVRHWRLGRDHWTTQRPLSAASASGATLTIYNDQDIEASVDRAGSIVTERQPGNGIIIASGANPDNDTYTVTLQPAPGVYTALGLEVVQDDTLPGVRVARGASRLQITEIEVESAAGRHPFAFAFSSVSNPTYETPATSAIDGNPETGWGLVTYGEGRNPFLALRFAKPLQLAPAQTLTVRLRHDSPFRKATTGRFRLALSSYAGPPGWFSDTRAELARAECRLRWLDAAIPRVVVTQATAPAPTRILPRGNWMDDSGEIVAPAIPAFLGALDTGQRRATRLDLANWLVSPNNPLTARVFVNRAWRQLFGAGLSKTLDDLGAQGEWPTHPELLDWLAAEFQSPSLAGARHAWDIKHLFRTIVLSHTYRQSSRPHPAAAQKDPDNRLLARQSRFRVDAEIVRDIALSASGLLTEKFGGPSVYPHQPEGYLAALNFPKREYSASRGADLYRRGVYTFWQRTFLHPALMIFDAPSREECTVNRTSSNTPLQALVLLNDPVFVEAARVFAQNMILHGGSSLPARLDWAFRRALSRLPSPQERDVLTRLYNTQLARLKKNPQDALQLARAGEAPLPPGLNHHELAATTLVARAILNLHETVTRN
jgi:hypothetical protein